MFDDDSVDILNRHFTVEEVRTALKDMHLIKAPGPNSFHALFYQTYWGKVRQNILLGVLGFLNGPFDTSELNETFMVLIPKVKNLSKITVSANQFV